MSDYLHQVVNIGLVVLAAMTALAGAWAAILASPLYLSPEQFPMDVVWLLLLTGVACLLTVFIYTMAVEERRICSETASWIDTAQEGESDE